MQIINCIQGSAEWHKARCGVITASNFADCCELLKNGSYSAKAKQYAFKLAIERISGELLQEDKFETWEMRRGREEEPNAREAHELRIGVMVEQTGIVVTDDNLFGASVDGLIDEDGQSEYKCFVSPTSLMPILLDGDISDCEYQIQGQLWVTGRKWCDFVLYCPALKAIGKDLTVFRVNRNDDFIAEMELKLLKFNELVCQYEQKLRSK
jgi:hypothetical protein